MDETRWGIVEIAKYYGWTPKHVRDRIIKRPDFPTPVAAPSPRRKFWRAEDVQRWAKG